MELISINISKTKGRNKSPVKSVRIDKLGIFNDAHRGKGLRQISFLDERSVLEFDNQSGRSFNPGDFGENCLVRNSPQPILPLDRLRIGTVQLEVTQLGKQCHGHGCAIFREIGLCVMPKNGFFCRVIEGGALRPGLPIHHTRRKMIVKIITVSDRAAEGAYEDRSGPAALESISEFPDWIIEPSIQVIPDSRTAIRKEITKALTADVILTLGGTGIGPRDITVDVVRPLCSKELPGIMEAIRQKFASTNPRALLSRSIAGVIDSTLIYTLPGNPVAVREYLSEIRQTLEHSLLMLRGLGHG